MFGAMVVIILFLVRLIIPVILLLFLGTILDQRNRMGI